MPRPGRGDAVGMSGHHTICTKLHAKSGSAEQIRIFSPTGHTGNGGPPRSDRRALLAAVNVGPCRPIRLGFTPAAAYFLPHVHAEPCSSSIRRGAIGAANQYPPRCSLAIRPAAGRRRLAARGQIRRPSHRSRPRRARRRKVSWTMAAARPGGGLSVVITAYESLARRGGGHCARGSQPRPDACLTDTLSASP
jgi:hypothetical protein